MKGKPGGTAVPPRTGRGWHGRVPSSLQGTRVWAVCGGHIHMSLKRNDEEATVKYSDMQIHGRHRKTMPFWVKFCSVNSIHGLEGRHTEQVGTDPDHVPVNAECRTHCCRGLPPPWSSVLDE